MYTTLEIPAETMCFARLWQKFGDCPRTFAKPIDAMPVFAIVLSQIRGKKFSRSAILDVISRRDMIAVSASFTLTASIAAGAGSGEQFEKEPSVTIDEKIINEMALRAKQVSEKAYCPYSKFRVGAVVLTEDNQIFEGCNVENASYGLTICAERNAIFQMVAKAKAKIVAVVIYTPTPTPAAPCGACRQVINEFGPDALVVSTCDGKEKLRKKLVELLPDAFGPGNLK